MGFWSKAWRAVKSVVRQIVKVVVTIVHNIIPNVLDLLLGFLKWPEKHMRIHIFVLKDPDTGKPLVSSSDLTPAIEYAKRVFKDKFNVKLHKYSKEWVEMLTDNPPVSALEPSCGGALYGQEFGEAGEYFANHTAGWNGIPISLTYPITVFIVKDVKDTRGCSLGPLTDWIVLDVSGVSIESNMAHELGHACNLWHSSTKSNLMYHPDDRGDGSKWFQRNLLRSCRHVNYY